MTPQMTPTRALIAVARVWQAGPSALMGPTCRFTPSCSAYAIEAWTRYGAVRGSWLAARRLCRCHPFGGHGYDPVP
jgi:putative membrane protein insertion efficiency factor